VVIDDAACMARALLLAERGRGRTSPNPMVGALVVPRSDCRPRSHERAGGPYAEVHALDGAGIGRGATLAARPCPRRAPRVVDAGIRRAVIAVEDPNPRVRGRGLQYLRDHGVDVQVGVMAEEAARLNRPFFTYIQHGRPFVTLKAALSLDGMVAARRGERTPLTGPETNALVHQERAEVDALAVGSETVLVDDPLLTVRGVYRDRPLTRVIFDRRLRTPPPPGSSRRSLRSGDRWSRADARERERADALRAVAPARAVESPDGEEADRRRSCGPRWPLAGVTCVARRRRRTAASRRVLARNLVDRVGCSSRPWPSVDGVEWSALPGGSIASLRAHRRTGWRRRAIESIHRAR
jgi:riboflavin biosynthesis pyrimidine reductase/pyrimidine deaminase RibD-like protein